MTSVENKRSALLSERMAGRILPRVLATFDMVAIFAAIVLFSTNAVNASPDGRIRSQRAGVSRSGRVRLPGPEGDRHHRP